MAVFRSARGLEIEIEDCDEQLAPKLAQSDKLKAGGGIATQVSGERLALVCKARCTIAEYRALMNLLKDGSRRYYYTPEETYTLWSDVEVPFPAAITDVQSSWDNRKVHYITYKVEATEFV